VSAKNTVTIGQELTGKYFDQLLPDFESTVTYRCLRKVVDSGIPNWRRGPPDLPHIDDYLEVERVMLPLASDGRLVDVILGLSVIYRSDGREF